MHRSEMVTRVLRGASLAVCVACAPARPSTAPAPVTATVTPPPPAVPAPAAVAPSTPPTTPRAVYRTAPADWHLLDPTADGVAGAGARRALRELLGTTTPKRQVTVAVIDGGVDTTHSALRSALVLNARETPANGKDDDGNGYVDDARGWNFIGGATGNIGSDRLELTRLVATCRLNGNKSMVSTPCAELERVFARERAEAERQWDGIRGVLTQYDTDLLTIAKDLGISKSAITDAAIGKLAPKTEAGRAALGRVQSFAQRGLTPSTARGARKQLEGQLNFGLNLQFDGRAVVGDTPAMGRQYGNADVTGPDASHGTAVASVIGAVSGDSGFVGVAPGVRLLPVRVVPDGDEYDKDVANGIRYAVDAGAQIINMSFGKAYSPGKALVDSAVQYAVSRGVLLVHASGNESADIDAVPTYPSAAFAGTPVGRAATWIDVGASSWRADANLPAEFSNYGRTMVDLFAPGVSVFSAAPENGFAREDGTSIAAPVVSGVAALLMTYFPQLTAADVKRILMASVTRYPDLMVSKPGGDGARVAFSTLSVSGGIVNAFEAVRMAQRESSK
jgi:subtilisin family serine protease